MQMLLHTNQSIAFVEKSALSTYSVESEKKILYSLPFQIFYPLGRMVRSLSCIRKNI